MRMFGYFVTLPMGQHVWSGPPEWTNPGPEDNTSQAMALWHGTMATHCCPRTSESGICASTSTWMECSFCKLQPSTICDMPSAVEVPQVLAMAHKGNQIGNDNEYLE